MLDFFVAAQRHLDDGDHLNRLRRETNAVHLWAYGAECTLKAIALKQGHTQIGAKGKPTNHFAQHLNQAKQSNQTNSNVLDLLSLYNASQSGTTAYLGPQTAFEGWDINARYEDGSQLHPIAQYASDAATFRKLLVTATVGGLLP